MQLRVSTPGVLHAEPRDSSARVDGNSAALCFLPVIPLAVRTGNMNAAASAPVCRLSSTSFPARRRGQWLKRKLGCLGTQSPPAQRVYQGKGSGKLQVRNAVGYLYREMYTHTDMRPRHEMGIVCKSMRPHAIRTPLFPGKHEPHTGAYSPTVFSTCVLGRCPLSCCLKRPVCIYLLCFYLIFYHLQIICDF